MRSVQDGAVPWLTPAALVCGGLALAFRPPATLGALVVTGLVGLVGALGPIPPRALPSQDRAPAAPLRWLQAVGVGVAAFALARWLQASPLPTPVVPLAVAGNALAAVAEELFFRRLMYGWLLRGGTGLAVGGAAAAFAAVHVPVYGLLVLPLDFAAGLLFGWQRWATGSWSASAVTHIAANLLQMR
jgi:membrane protease YdiL (CAAX protease family)